MKIPEPKNKNYCATVVRIKNIIPLENCDNVVATTIFGFQAIVSKDVKVGDIGIVFPAETQLSNDYCSANNLYRHANLNDDIRKTGYIEDNRRIKAVKFRGHTSNCLFMPMQSVAFATKHGDMAVYEMNEGVEFDELDGFEICRKYEVRTRESRGNKMSGQKKVPRVDSKHMPEHFDTDNFWKNKDKVGEGEPVIVTQKLHGTSVRIGYTLANRSVSFLERVARYFGAAIQEKQYELVCASRKVIKDEVGNQHYYDTDIWTLVGRKLEGVLPKNYIVYGEIIGWTPEGAPIQKNYTYNVPKGEAHLYVYRIAIVNEDGFITDLTWEQIKTFCNQYGLDHVPELGFIIMRDAEDWVNELMDKDFSMFPQFAYKSKVVPLREGAITSSSNDIVDEGVCVRAELGRLTPYILKAKSPKFLEHETKLMDAGEEDTESTQS